MPARACPHHRTQLIAKDSEAQYVECLDCGEILETGEISPSQEAEKKVAGFDESLSDA
jgi:transcription initiation factor TFIIIB Brf1 subunit/transcription initiation factor TFIIB